MTRYTLFDETGVRSTPSITLPRLALHVLTDFRPWAPPNVHAGLLPFLSWMVEQAQPPVRWRSHAELVDYEKQWRSVISWVIGSAFCREAIDSLGWSAGVLPLSVLTKKRGPLGLWVARVRAVFANISVRVTRPRKGNMPDYLAVRPALAASGYAFFEAKGGLVPTIGKTPVGKQLAKALTGWTRQALNADLVIGGATVAAERRIVAARVHPGAHSRDVHVRRWNVTPPSLPALPPPATPAAGSQGAPAASAAQDPSRAAPGVQGPVLEYLSRAMQLKQVGLASSADAMLEAAAALSTVDNRTVPTSPIKPERARSELAQLTRLVVANSELVEIDHFDLGRGAPGAARSDTPRTLHVGIDAVTAEQIGARFEPVTRDQALERWRAQEDRPSREIRDGNTLIGIIRPDGFAAWLT